MRLQRPTVGGMAVTAGIVTGLTVLVLVVIRLLSPSTPNPDPIVLPPAVVAPAINWQAEEDKRALHDLIDSDQGTGYDCEANANAKSIAELRLCPDYVAYVSFGETGKPAIVTPIAPDGVYPIELTAEPYKSCAKPGSSDYTGKKSCEQMYRIRWTVYPTFVPLGYNEENIEANGTTSWHGPYGPDFETGNMLVSPKDTRTVEVYIGDAALNSFNEPLDDARLAKS